MYRHITRSLVPGLVASALFAWACERPATPAGPKPAFWFTPGPENCQAGPKFTGGGRIDPVAGKTTFGFNVNAKDWCSSSTGTVKGQLQTVYHPTQTLVHSLGIDAFESYPSDRINPKTGRPGQCAHFAGPARVKDGNGPWNDGERFEATACDNGEPGSSPGRGPDQYGIRLSDGRFVPLTDLTGGNIQAHPTH